MKYNKVYEGENFEKYLEYLDTIKDKLPNDIFDFFSDSNRHDLGAKSLHDSWVKSLECANDFDTQTTEITIVLFGPYHDREFHLHFKKVSQHKISQPRLKEDLITYEIGVEKDYNNEKKLIFRAEFEDTEIEIYTEQIEIKEKIIKNGG
jgi:hypothetical protein